MLASFQTSLDEITVNAIPASLDFEDSKAIQIHSYVDPGKGGQLPFQNRKQAHKIVVLCPNSISILQSLQAYVQPQLCSSCMHHVHSTHLASILCEVQVRQHIALLAALMTPFACAENSEAALRTQLELDAQKVFLGYDHAGTEPSDVTFNLKDFKAMLSLCEALSSNVAIRFDGPGNPLVVKPHNRGTHAQVMLTSSCALRRIAHAL